MMGADWVKKVLFAVSFLYGPMATVQAITITVTNTADSGDGTLRQALIDINLAAEPANDVLFDFSGPPPYIISITSSLPAITATTTIDGSSQTNYSLINPPILLNGGSNLFDCFQIDAASSEIRGLVIRYFGFSAVRMSSGGNTIAGNHIFLNGTGVTVLAAGNMIGGTNAGDRNFISRNYGRGVMIYGTNAGNNAVWGNFIGPDIGGTNVSSWQGIGIHIQDSSSNSVGSGTSGGPFQLISGNGLGVFIEGSNAYANAVQGNRIGTMASGLSPLTNGFGIYIMGAPQNRIGGTNSNERNVISGNAVDGITLTNRGAYGNIILGNYIGLGMTGINAVPNGGEGVNLQNAPSNTVGTNCISGNLSDGIRINGSNAVGNIVVGNTVGLNILGAAVSNGFNGLTILGASSNTIGGIIPLDKNVFSGNGQNGIFIAGATTSGNIIQGNHIGISINGLEARPNGMDGIVINDAHHNTVGSTNSGGRNAISGNTQNGLRLIGSSASNNRIIGNYIGTDISGTFALTNGVNGILVLDAPNNIIGGADLGTRNTVSGNGESGIVIGGAGSTNTQVLGNYVGVDSDGLFAVPNNLDGLALGAGIEVRSSCNILGGTNESERNIVSGNLGYGILLNTTAAKKNVLLGNAVGVSEGSGGIVSNLWSGIYVLDGQSNILGGTVFGSANLVGGNGEYGILISGTNATGNQLFNNYIGTNPNHTNFGNGLSGIAIFDARQNLIGDPNDAEARNYIAYNNGAGIVVTGATALGNGIFSVSTYSNATIGIDLANDGITANDGLGDVDNGPNELQNRPVLTNAFRGSTHIKGYLESKTSTSYRIDFYVNAMSNHEGIAYIGYTNITTDLAGTGVFYAVFRLSVPLGHFVMATATDLDMNTSEFSDPIPVVAPYDSDGDGIPDFWEIEYGLNPLVPDADIDSDNDSFRNGDEYVADTDPQDFEELLYIEAITNNVPRYVDFETVTGRVYNVQWATNINDTVWNNVQTNIVGVDGLLSIPDLTSGTQGIYRVTVQLPN